MTVSRGTTPLVCTQGGTSAIGPVPASSVGRRVCQAGDRRQSRLHPLAHLIEYSRGTDEWVHVNQ